MSVLQRVVPNIPNLVVPAAGCVTADYGVNAPILKLAGTGDDDLLAGRRSYSGMSDSIQTRILLAFE